MNGQTLQHVVQITNPQGFHLRPMGAFAQLACRFQSKVQLSWEGRSGNGKSILDLMALAAPAGSEFVVEVDGPDAPQALDALVSLLQSYATEELVEPRS